jgi:hypothetical protein
MEPFGRFGVGVGAGVVVGVVADVGGVAVPPLHAEADKNKQNAMATSRLRDIPIPVLPDKSVPVL